MMRIITGRQRHRKLRTPEGLGTRPILDRVKQALFDALGAWHGTPARLPPLRVIDIFCGGGTMGLECLSRGAKHAAFVDQGRAALDCLRHNLRALQLADAATICAGDAAKTPFPMIAGHVFDIVFLDPPFPMSTAHGRGDPQLGRIFARFERDIRVAPEALCIWRFDERHPPATFEVPGWQIERRKTYGRSEIVWLLRGQAAHPEESPDSPLRAPADNESPADG
jgi:16S rRNA (guanine966-N2)-methyltransferase